uniref:Uncharacterized protein n=1 Tax=Rhizophora mucronata TaxID=61149 RepID=A0A2P2IRV0_RHIMU
MHLTSLASNIFGLGKIGISLHWHGIKQMHMHMSAQTLCKAYELNSK